MDYKDFSKLSCKERDVLDELTTFFLDFMASNGDKEAMVMKKWDNTEEKLNKIIQIFLKELQQESDKTIEKEELQELLDMIEEKIDKFIEQKGLEI